LTTGSTIKVRDELDSYTSEILAKYGKNLNQHLKRMGVDFRIKIENKAAFAGGRPSLEYYLCLRDHPIQLGRPSEMNEMPSFRTVLSEGDKSTLAFALFLARLDLDPHIDQKIIVFDDPITSLDAHRQSQTVYRINAIAKKARQVIVLTHDLLFARRLWHECPDKSELKEFKIKRTKQGSSIVCWNLERETQGEYYQNYFTLADYLDYEYDGELLPVVRCIRPILEANFRLRWPKEFHSKMCLGDFIESIRESEPGSPLYSLLWLVDEMSDINSYCRRYHHSNPEADTALIIDQELRQYVGRTLDLIRGVWGEDRSLGDEQAAPTNE